MISSLVLAEMMALWRSLHHCTELGLHNVVFEGDARRIIENIKALEEKLSLLAKY